MIVKNKMAVKIPAKSVNESLARLVVASFVSQLDPTIDAMADIKTAVSEAVTNCIVHAYKNEGGIVHINCKYDEKNTVTIQVRDTGCGIEDVGKATAPLFTTDKTGERSGMGFSIMESFTDKLSVSSKVGKGTTVTMKKKL